MSRWVIHSRGMFEARHALTSYQGKEESPHHHRWEVAIRVGTERLNAEHFALDFHAVHQILTVELDALDGTPLNDHPEIGSPSPTAERVAEVLAERMTPQWAALGGTLLSISVWEGPDNRVDLNLDR
ncbi:MAG: 6-carboxytetrahydropterin synthase [Acidobacteriota bacterium]|nr:6-carboxytetrahydropterin synthase [Acidobacteriota bacterium]